MHWLRHQQRNYLPEKQARATVKIKVKRHEDGNMIGSRQNLHEEEEEEEECKLGGRERMPAVVHGRRRIEGGQQRGRSRNAPDSILLSHQPHCRRLDLDPGLYEAPPFRLYSILSFSSFPFLLPLAGFPYSLIPFLGILKRKTDQESPLLFFIIPKITKAPY